MAGTKTSALAALTTVADGDILPIVDISDTTQAPTGSTKKTTIADIVDSDAVGNTLPYPDAARAGVVIDGVTDDRVGLNAYIDDCDADDRPCYLRSGIYKLTTNKLVGKGRIFGAGRGKTIIRQGSTNATVLDFDSLSDWEVSGLTIESAASPTNFRSLWIRGNGERGVVRDVQIVNGGLYVSGGLASFDPTPNPTTPGTQKRVVLESVFVDSAGEYGISIDGVQGVDIIGAQIVGAGIDGIKCLHTCDDVTITGGFATLCGQEGIDAFMGGRNLTIVGFKAFQNTGNGITVKSDHNPYDEFDYKMNAQITIVGVICRDNSGYGLTIDRQGATDDPLNWLLSHCTVHGGVFEDNTFAGVKVRARNVSLVSPVCRRNGRQGIEFLPEAMDCDIVSPQVSGNSQTTVNTYDGILVAGTRTKVIGGFSIGKDADSIKNDGDYAALTAQQRYGVVIQGGSTDCSILDTVAFGNATGDLATFGTRGMIRSRNRFDFLDAGATVRNISMESSGKLVVPGVHLSGEAEIDGALNHDGTTVGFYGSTPVVKAGNPGTASGTDAAVINAVVTALRNLGLVT